VAISAYNYLQMNETDDSFPSRGECCHSPYDCLKSTTVLAAFVQGVLREVNSNITTAIAAGGVSHGKDIAARDIQFSNDPSSPRIVLSVHSSV
jgi:hypothetical protein